MHIVFSTKYRLPFIDERIEEDLFMYLGGICRRLGCQPVEVGGYREHVHILCIQARTITSADMVKEIKRVSSNWMKHQGNAYRQFRWQDGYAIFSVDYRSVGRVVTYIRNQAKHHKKTEFKREYLGILEEYGFEYAEEYLWD